MGQKVLRIFRTGRYKMPNSAFVLQMKKRPYSQAFPNLSLYGAAATSIYQAFKRPRGGYTILGNDSDGMGRLNTRFKRRRGGSRTITKRRRKFRRGSRLIKRVRRINRSLYRKGIKSMEIKYYQGSEATTRANTGSNVIYGISENTFQNNANALPLNSKISVTTGIGKSTDRDQRVGNKIWVRHLRIRGGVWASIDGAAANEVYIKMIVLRVKEAQGTPTSAFNEIPKADNIFDSVNVTGTRWNGSGIITTTPAADAQSKIMVNFTNVWKYLHARWGNDFQVLKTKVFKVSKETGINAEKKLFKLNIPIFKPAHWDDASNPQDGHIFIYYWADCVSQDPNLAVATAGFVNTRPCLGFTWRLSYTDV